MAALFEWDADKDYANRLKHGVGFPEAQMAFLDRDRVIAEDTSHGNGEQRFFCLGVVSGRGHQDHWRRLLAQGPENL